MSGRVDYVRGLNFLFCLPSRGNQTILTLPQQLSVAEIDRLIQNLDDALDTCVPTLDNDEIKSVGTSGQKEQEEYALRFEFPAEIWQQFVEYCKQNELDPAMQIREAVASYYKDLLKIVRIRTRLHNANESNMA